MIPPRAFNRSNTSRNLQSHTFHKLHVPHQKLKYCERAFSCRPDRGTVYPIILSQQPQQLSSKRSLKLTCLSNIMDNRRAPHEVFLKKMFLFKIDLATNFQNLLSSYKNSRNSFFHFNCIQKHIAGRS